MTTDIAIYPFETEWQERQKEPLPDFAKEQKNDFGVNWTPNPLTIDRLPPLTPNHHAKISKNTHATQESRTQTKQRRFSQLCRWEA